MKKKAKKMRKKTKRLKSSSSRLQLAFDGHGGGLVEVLRNPSLIPANSFLGVLKRARKATRNAFRDGNPAKALAYMEHYPEGYGWESDTNAYSASNEGEPEVYLPAGKSRDVLDSVDGSVSEVDGRTYGISEKVSHSFYQLALRQAFRGLNVREIEFKYFKQSSLSEPDERFTLRGNIDATDEEELEGMIARLLNRFDQARDQQMSAATLQVTYENKNGELKSYHLSVSFKLPVMRVTVGEPKGTNKYEEFAEEVYDLQVN